jgi:hypothetical protein
VGNSAVTGRAVGWIVLTRSGGAIMENRGPIVENSVVTGRPGPAGRKDSHPVSGAIMENRGPIVENSVVTDRPGLMASSSARDTDSARCFLDAVPAIGAGHH